MAFQKMQWQTDDSDFKVHVNAKIRNASRPGFNVHVNAKIKNSSRTSFNVHVNALVRNP